MSPSGAELLRRVKSQINEVDPSEVKELVSEGVAIIDVRGSEEFATGHLPGAKSVPRGHLEARIESAAPDRSAEVILYCASGNRSAYAARTLQMTESLFVAAKLKKDEPHVVLDSGDVSLVISFLKMDARRGVFN